MERRVISVEKFQTREEGGKRYLDGYYSVFNEPYEVFPGWIEEIAPGAFSRTLRENKDVKVLWNHDSNIVLGSTENRTASLQEDERGLHGPVEINEEDQDAKNAYARVNRGDVRGCSFGFDVRAMEESWDDDGIYRTRLTDVELYEVSPCTFPAYAQTSISARNKESLDDAKKRFEAAREQQRKDWRESMNKRLKGER
nr:MAG TPA: prohead serine protease [Caudoviricetes sp.]